MLDLTITRSWLNSRTDSDLETIARTVEADGIYCSQAFLSPEDLNCLQRQAANVVSEAESQSVSLADKHLAGSGVDELERLPEFKTFCSRLSHIAHGLPVEDVTFHTTFRCLTGASMVRHSLKFHYDSYLITVLLPVIIPTTGLRGDFLIIPNTRPVRSTYIANIVDKALVDNRATQSTLRRKSGRSTWIKRVAMVPGSLYLFWGYRSIHTNDAIDESALRATALFHCIDPHRSSPTKRLLGRL